MPAIEEFFTKFVAKRLRTRNRTAQKYITCLQNFATYVEKKNIAIHELPEVKSGIATHSEVRKEAQAKNAHEFDPHDDIPERVISREDENKLINLALDYSSNKILDFSESMLFLTSFTSTTQRLIRCESLLRHNYPDFYTTSSEDPHRKWSKDTLLRKTGCNYFEKTLYLIQQPYQSKKKKESKKMTGAYRHYDLFHCSTFYLAATLLIYHEKHKINEFNFIINREAGDSCELLVCNKNVLICSCLLAAISSHWQTVRVIESAYYSEEERKEIANTEDENKKRQILYRKINRIYHKVFKHANVKMPLNKVLHIGRVIGMNFCKDEDVGEPDITAMSGHLSKNEGTQVAKESYFSMTPLRTMSACCGVPLDEDWLVCRTFKRSEPHETRLFTELDN